MGKKRVHQSTDDDDMIAQPDGSKIISKSSRENKQMRKKAIFQSSSSSTEKKEPINSRALSATTVEILDKRTDNTTTEERQCKYDAFTRAPFLIHVRMVSAAVNASGRGNKRFSLLDISKKLKNANIKFTQIQKYAFNTWKVFFASKIAANSVLINKFLREAGLIAFIPRYKISRRIVIREIPEDMPLSELKTAIEEENSNILVTKMFRLRRRDKSTGQYVDSQSLCLEIRRELLPESIHIL